MPEILINLVCLARSLQTLKEYLIQEASIFIRVKYAKEDYTTRARVYTRSIQRTFQSSL